MGVGMLSESMNGRLEALSRRTSARLVSARKLCCYRIIGFRRENTKGAEGGLLEIDPERQEPGS